MANYWAITIGINQYRHLQPLMHAQNDARAIHRFLTGSAEIAASHCALLSDLTTSVGDQAVYPDKPAIAEWMQTITQQVGADDVLWVFFSGYGVQSENADYLLPIDGEPGNAKETGIAVVDLINSLAQLPTDKTLLILDMNRSQGAFAGQTIGTETIELAQKHRIPLLLSCQPGQFSHETLGIRQGLFTAAILEALQQQCTTLAEISDYVDIRLPELCEHHWRPTQNAVSLMFDEQKDDVIVPAFQTPFTDVASTPVVDPVAVPIINPATSTANSNVTVNDSTEDTAGTATNGAAIGSPAVAVLPKQIDSKLLEDEHPDSKNGSASSLEPASSAIVPYRNGTERAISGPTYRSGADEAISGAKLRNWGLLALALLLLGGVLFRQPAIRTAMRDLADRATALTGSDTRNSSDGDAEDSSDSVAESGEGTDSADAPETQASETPAVPDTVPVSASDRPEDATAAELIAQANASVAREQYSEALITLQQVPKAQRDSTFAETLTEARAGAVAAQQANASVLNDARTSIQPIQASQFTEAIAKARLIQPGEPLYEEAQQDIRSWSQVILDVAEGRATSGNLDGAIAAASVMPYDNAELYQTSKDRIAFWQQRQNSRAIIADAQSIPRSGQASSYQEGIVKLREVSIEHPEYETAQRLADDWSQRIFSIAQARAAQGRLRAAVQAAVLVPAGTAAYEPTQQAIKRWQSEL